MRLLDRYLLLEWLKALGLALGATLGALLLEDLYSNVGDLLVDGAHGHDVIHYYQLLLPSFLPAVLPMSQLVSLLFVIGNLHRNNEITVMRAAGLSLWRIAQPLWVGGAILAGLLAWLDSSIVIRSVEQAGAFRNNLHHAALLRANPDTEAGLIQDLSFDNENTHRLWMINKFNPRTAIGQGISIFEFDAQGINQRYVLAKRGHYDKAVGGWVLEEGREIHFAADGIDQPESPTFDKKIFSEFEKDSPELMLQLRQKPGDLSLDELHSVVSQPATSGSNATDAYWVAYYSMLAKPMICLLVVGLAVPFAVAGVRTSPLAGASKAIGLFFVYYFVSGISTHLGYQHYLPAMLAAWLPIAVMFGFSVWFFRKAV